MHGSLRPAPLSHAASFAQQLLVHQHEQARSGFRADGTRHEMYQTSPFALQRAATDSHAPTFRFQLPADEGNASNAGSGVGPGRPNSLFDPPSALARTQSDSVQHLFPHSGHSHTPPRMLNGEQQQSTQLYQTSHPQPHHASMHISLPPARPPYAFDFSPGSPYEVYNLTMAAQMNGQAEGWKMEMISQDELRQLPISSESHSRKGSDETYTRSSTSPAPAPVPMSFRFGKAESFAQHAHTQSESLLKTASAPVTASASAQNSQPQTEVTSPVSTSPTSGTQSSAAQSGTSPPSSNATHPAHPGPIALPPPPNVAGFPIPPPHTLSPAYHPQMSPYASPLHHPAIMMGMMGVNMTPHGLPPITPSMPSFTFLPQPSPNAQPTGRMGEQQSSTNVPGSSHTNGTGDAQLQPHHHQGGYIAHLLPHGPMLSPYTPFSPGVAMSPGAFWAGSAGVNPYMNAAVGAPVHSQQQHSGYFPPVAQRPPEEPQGYFPPFMPSSASLSASKPSGLANEIQPDGASASGSAENGSVADGGYAPGPPSTGTTIATNATPVELTSSNGTSWHTHSGDPSPDSGLAGDMGKMSINAGKEEIPVARANSAELFKGNIEHVEALLPLQRADSDPVQATSPTRPDAPGADGLSRVGLGFESQHVA